MKNPSTVNTILHLGFPLFSQKLFCPSMLKITVQIGVKTSNCWLDNNKLFTGKLLRNNTAHVWWQRKHCSDIQDTNITIYEFMLSINVTANNSWAKYLL